MPAQLLDGLDREHTVRAPAVGDDKEVLREVRDIALEVRKRDGDRTGDVAGLVLDCGTDVDQGHVPRLEPAPELGGTHGLEGIAVVDIRARELVHVLEAPPGQRLDLAKDAHDAVVREPVVDELRLLARLDEARGPQGLEV